MSRFFTQGVALLVLVTLIANSNGQQWYDCGTTLSQRLVRFNTFAAFPSPAIPGQQVHLRATYQAYAQLDSNATVQMSVMYGSESVLAVSGIPLCNLTSSVSCPVVATPNYTQAISFDWTVPSVADGNYLVNFKIVSPGKASAFGCITFNISVSNPSATQNGVFVSSYQAQLEGAAQFTTSPYSSRGVGSSIQVGPIGPLGASLPWGTFGYVYGTGDVVHPSFDPTNYIWGMSGTLVNKSIDQAQSSNFYEGQFWIGYSGPYGNYNTQNNTLTSGTFTLYHSQISSSNYTFNGLFTFLPYGGAFPTGWFNPINLARLGPAVLSTDQYGHLIAGASTGTCLASPTLTTCPGVNNQVSQGTARNNDPNHINIILPVVLGVFFLIILPLIVWAAIRYHRKQKKASEDRVYNPRPAEYGSALVVDDIMQKSRNHTGAALPILDPSSRQSFPPVYLDDMPAPVVANPRTVRRTPQEPRIDDRRRRSTRQDRRPAPRRPAYSDSDSEPQLRGRGGNRSRSPESRGRDLSRSRSRSRSVSRSRSISRSRSLSRSRSPSRSERGSRSRSVSRSRSPSGSSVSRSSYSEGPRR